ncbi:MAG: hypothetical protein EBR82_68840 [Caulobacteraceae bacterium]|nr:hypothetical protein [Caulobacteraceae bacterium]
MVFLAVWRRQALELSLKIAEILSLHVKLLSLVLVWAFLTLMALAETRLCSLLVLLLALLATLERDFWLLLAVLRLLDAKFTARLMKLTLQTEMALTTPLLRLQTTQFCQEMRL